ncbi:MAG: GumC family protein [Gemmatimonadaceae bacterium]
MSAPLAPLNRPLEPAVATPATPSTWSPDAAGPDEGGTPISRYWAAIKRYKWPILILVVLGTLAGVTATRFVTPLYEARAALWIGGGSAGVENGDRGTVRAVEILAPTDYLELMTSFAVVDRVVERLHLYVLPKLPSDSTALVGFRPTPAVRTGPFVLKTDATGNAYVLTNADGVVLDKGAIGDSIGRSLGFRWAPRPGSLGPNRKIDFSVASPRQVAVGLVGSLVPSAVPEKSNFIRLSLTGPDGPWAVRILNIWLEELVATASEVKRRNLTALAEILDQQKNIASVQLKKSEAALQSFRVRAITEPTDAPASATDPLFSDYFGQRVELDRAQSERESLSRLLAESPQGPGLVTGLYGLPSVLEAVPELKAALSDLSSAQAKLATMRQVYTDEYKGVRDAVVQVNALQQQTIPQLARTAVDRLTRRQSELGRRVAGQQQNLRNIPTRSIEEARLRREMGIAENLYSALESRDQAVKLAWQSATPDVNVLDFAATSQLPSKNRAPFIILFAFAGSLLLGSAIAIGADRLDHRFRYPEQATADLGLEILGAIPTMKKGEEFTSPEEASQIIEAFRTIRMQVSNACHGARPMVLTVTSPGMGDGKTTVASNLALSFVEAGHRTLLIDGDTRLGTLHSVFGITRRPGLLDYLLGMATTDEILRPSTTHKNLTVLPSGIRRHHGPELLASPELPKLLEQVRDRYDVILVDSPPLGAGIDPFALSVATGNVLLVLRTGSTDRHMAEAKLQLLERLPTRVLGAVLNDIHADGLYRHYSYLGGYYTTEEEEALPARIPVPR